MGTDKFEALRPNAGCLSALQLSNMARGATVSPQATAHAESCTVCGAKLSDERVLVAAMALKPVPQAVLDAAQKRSVWNWKWVGMLVPVAAAASLLLLFQPAQQALEPVMVKGAVALSVTVTRGEVTVLDDIPLETLHGTQSGDKLHLRAVTPLNKWVVLQGHEGSHWVDYFAGPRPADGWLPIIVGVTDNEKSELRIIACDSEQDARVSAPSCEEKRYAF